MIRLGINGLGRIGRAVTRLSLERKNIEVAAINSRADTNSHAYLLKYDSVHGTLSQDVKADGNKLRVDKKYILCCAEKQPADIPWENAKVDIVIESTGIFKTRRQAAKHLGKSVKKVILSLPGEDPDITVVLGVNEKNYDNDNHKVISNASCTTNCLAPVCKVLNEKFEIKRGFMTTTHAVTASQTLLDRSNSKDPRRGRAAFSSIIPTSTGASKALGLVMPELEGKIKALSMRVPTPNVSVIDLALELERKISADQVARIFKKAEKQMEGIIGVAEDRLVSSDFVGSTYSAVVDPYLTQTNGKWVRIFAWYDNEFGYSARLLDLAEYIYTN